MAAGIRREKWQRGLVLAGEKINYFARIQSITGRFVTTNSTAWMVQINTPKGVINEDIGRSILLGGLVLQGVLASAELEILVARKVRLSMCQSPRC